MNHGDVATVTATPNQLNMFLKNGQDQQLVHHLVLSVTMDTGINQ